MSGLGQVLWAVGPEATVEVLVGSKNDPPGLSLSLDPGEVLIASPAGKGDRAMFAAFLLDLADAAMVLAERLDPDGMPAPAEAGDRSGRCFVARDPFGDSGGGYQ
ncbi:hypothetical protein EV192_1024 [Actinocrispum wychmicini]|uniref:Uncharacterized protein n=1 Tax=Actinocrispum wychmicini TaxID=1213861 RepID=A0A4R2JS05_9PSEU|nr:hypothetical protein EV192_1024 [Actinocrispum wychmicini]